MSAAVIVRFHNNDGSTVLQRFQCGRKPRASCADHDHVRLKVPGGLRRLCDTVSRNHKNSQHKDC